MRQLIELVVNKGDIPQLLSLLKNLPVPPLEAIKSRIIDSGDNEVIEQMTVYLEMNPEGIGSDVSLVSGQKDRIVPMTGSVSGSGTSRSED